ncbi:hypothetical protein BGP_2213 [Beggiatoa sp. PS]|nr:hypothetical protein BGP_2213 [Beggiatoa sp. PS]
MTQATCSDELYSTKLTLWTPAVLLEFKAKLSLGFGVQLDFEVQSDASSFGVQSEALGFEVELTMTKDIPVYYFSKIKDDELRTLVKIKQKFSNPIFDNWFNYQIILKDNDIQFITELLNKEFYFIRIYKEEDLKVKFIAPILNRIDFRDVNKEIRDFYEEKITYQTDKFIFTGTTDFLISKGLEYSEKPYFFIQEFKKGKESSYPESQLLAELIAGVELNNFKTIKGAYIVGAIWNFVILEKLAEGHYQFFISINFDSTKIEELKGIYKNLLFIKDEIFKMVESDFLENQ